MIDAYTPCGEKHQPNSIGRYDDEAELRHMWTMPDIMEHVREETGVETCNITSFGPCLGIEEVRIAHRFGANCTLIDCDSNALRHCQNGVWPLGCMNGEATEEGIASRIDECDVGDIFSVERGALVRKVSDTLQYCETDFMQPVGLPMHTAHLVIAQNAIGCDISPGGFQSQQGLYRNILSIGRPTFLLLNEWGLIQMDKTQKTAQRVMHRDCEWDYAEDSWVAFLEEVVSKHPRGV